LHDFFTKSEYLKLKNKLNIIKKALLLSWIKDFVSEELFWNKFWRFCRFQKRNLTFTPIYFQKNIIDKYYAIIFYYSLFFFVLKKQCCLSTAS
jgi:hypothetical protein